MNNRIGWNGGNRLAMLVAGLLLIAGIFGGGGTPSPLSELVVQLAAAVVLAIWVLLREPRTVPKAALLLAGLVILLPLLQLVPLPPAVWQSLPGRAVEQQSLALIGSADRWMPLSMVPSRTLAGLLSLVAPLAILVMTASLNPEEQRFPVAAAALLGVLTALVGAAQLADGSGRALRFYSYTNLEWVTGFQANRNATVDVLLIGIAAAAACVALWHLRNHAPGRSSPKSGGTAPERRKDWRTAGRPNSPRSRKWLVAAVVILPLAFAAVMTGSRAGIALLIPVLAAAALLLASPGARLRGRTLALAAAGLMLGLGALLLAIARVPRIAAVINRFDASGDFRSELWNDTWYAVAAHWPWGGGLGSFQTLMVAAERLEVVDRTRPNRAHNDYLELLLEGGAPGMVLLVAAAGVLIYAAVRKWRAITDPRDRIYHLFTMTCIGVIALHSLVDYPLRSMSLASLMAMAAGLLLAPVRGSPHLR